MCLIKDCVALRHTRSTKLSLCSWFWLSSLWRFGKWLCVRCLNCKQLNILNRKRTARTRIISNDGRTYTYTYTFYNITTIIGSIQVTRSSSLVQVLIGSWHKCVNSPSKYKDFILLLHPTQSNMVWVWRCFRKSRSRRKGAKSKADCRWFYCVGRMRKEKKQWKERKCIRSFCAIKYSPDKPFWREESTSFGDLTFSTLNWRVWLYQANTQNESQAIIFELQRELPDRGTAYPQSRRTSGRSTKVLDELTLMEAYLDLSIRASDPRDKPILFTPPKELLWDDSKALDANHLGVTPMSIQGRWHLSEIFNLDGNCDSNRRSNKRAFGVL